MNGQSVMLHRAYIVYPSLFFFLFFYTFFFHSVLPESTPCKYVNTAFVIDDNLHFNVISVTTAPRRIAHISFYLIAPIQFLSICTSLVQQLLYLYLWLVLVQSHLFFYTYYLCRRKGFVRFNWRTVVIFYTRVDSFTGSVSYSSTETSDQQIGKKKVVRLPKDGQWRIPDRFVLW